VSYFYSEWFERASAQLIFSTLNGASERSCVLDIYGMYTHSHFLLVCDVVILCEEVRSDDDTVLVSPNPHPLHVSVTFHPTHSAL
jgi:hypothetical protein